MLVVYVALQGAAAVNKRLSNRGVLAGYSPTASASEHFQKAFI